MVVIIPFASWDVTNVAINKATPIGIASRYKFKIFMVVFSFSALKKHLLDFSLVDAF